MPLRDDTVTVLVATIFSMLGVRSTGFALVSAGEVLPLRFITDGVAGLGLVAVPFPARLRSSIPLPSSLSEEEDDDEEEEVEEARRSSECSDEERLFPHFFNRFLLAWRPEADGEDRFPVTEVVGFFALGSGVDFLLLVRLLGAASKSLASVG